MRMRQRMRSLPCGVAVARSVRGLCRRRIRAPPAFARSCGHAWDGRVSPSFLGVLSFRSPTLVTQTLPTRSAAFLRQPSLAEEGPQGVRSASPELGRAGGSAGGGAGRIPATPGSPAPGQARHTADKPAVLLPLVSASVSVSRTHGSPHSTSVPQGPRRKKPANLPGWETQTLPAKAGQEPLHHEEPVVAGQLSQSEEQRAAGRPRRRRDLGSRLQVQRRAQRVAWGEVDENEEEAIGPDQEDEGIEKPVETHPTGKIGAKKLRKLEEKQARKAQREAEEAEREERKRLESQREAEWKKEEERIRLQEEQKEEEERKAREEQARREHEEYLKLKEAFVVEEEGVGETMTEEQSHNFLTEFINYIKQSKVVLLEDLASHVGLRTQDTINRIQDLLAEGTLTGVIDDRGKFIYITPEELAAVAGFIRQRGRVSITELAQASNSLIAWGQDVSSQTQA